MNFIAKAAIVALSVAGLTAAAGAQAHHSFAMFDNQKELTLEGVVKEFQWTNPHSWIQLMVKDASGKEVEWSLEGASPNSLARKGWSRNSIKAGDKAVIVVNPLKDGGPGGSLKKVVVNGQTIGNR